MEKWNLNPTQKIGNLKFGLHRKDIRSIINKQFKEYKKSQLSENTTDDYIDFQIFYNKDDSFVAIEIFDNIELTIDDKVIFPNNVENIKIIFPNLVKDDENHYIDYDNSIGVEVDNSKISSILFGCVNYYKL